MLGKFLKPAALSCGFFLIALLATLDGKWTGTITTPDGSNVPVSYNFKVDGATLTGTAGSPHGTATIDSGKIAGNDFSFSVTVDGNAYPHKGKIYDDSCGIDINFGGPIVHTTLLRDTAK